MKTQTQASKKGLHNPNAISIRIDPQNIAELQLLVDEKGGTITRALNKVLGKVLKSMKEETNEQF